MDGGRVIYRLTEVYVALLVLGSIGTVVWFYVPNVASSPTLAGLWFALGGFGALIGITIIIVQYGRGSPQRKRREREVER